MSTADPRTPGPVTAPLEKLRQEMDHLLEVAWSNGARALDAFGLSPSVKSWAPAVDVLESDDGITVLVDVPGIDPQSIDVTLTGNMLTLKGERLLPPPPAGQICHLVERGRGAFSRSIPIPVPVNPDHVHAEARNGTLSIRLAKQQSAKPRQIIVEPRNTPG